MTPSRLPMESLVDDRDAHAMDPWTSASVGARRGWIPPHRPGSRWARPAEVMEAEVMEAEVNPFGLAVRGVPTGFEPGDGVVVGVLLDSGEVRMGSARVVSRAGGKLRLAWA
jgi:hypothetical protein